MIMICVKKLTDSFRRRLIREKKNDISYKQSFDFQVISNRRRSKDIIYTKKRSGTHLRCDACEYRFSVSVSIVTGENVSSSTTDATDTIYTNYTADALNNSSGNRTRAEKLTRFSYLYGSLVFNKM